MRIDDGQDVYTKERKVLHFDQVGIDHLIRLGSVHNRAVRPSGEEHVHRDSFELVFFEGGQQQYQVGREIYTVHSREMFLTYPNEPHCIMDCKEEKSQFYYLILYFPRDLKRFAGLSPESTDLVRRFFYSSQRIAPISRQLLTLLGSIVKLYFSSEPLRVELIRAKTVELLYELVKIPELARADPTDSDSIMEQLLDFIGQNPTRPITLEELAAQVHLSIPRIQQLFKEQLGLTPHDYILRYRIELAQEMLRYTDCSITEIAFQLGFSTSQHFATTFQKYTLETPSGYRKSRRLRPLP